jgi:response regulator RpfG family c-di-GMP phosphodiesterase
MSEYKLQVLVVDDEAQMRNALKTTLESLGSTVTLANNGREALTALDGGSFDLIISDMRMPEMDGVQFLKHVKQITPNSVRMMLTGNADQQTAIEAVNQGSIFRFLTKPCPPEIFAETINAGLEQYQLITAEKVLLNETLNKSLQVMVEILSMVNPTAFSRSNRIKRLAKDIAIELGLKNTWEIEIAAMLSQIGCVIVPEETLQKIKRSEPLNEKELQLYHQHPNIAHNLISRIPRLQSVAEIISLQSQFFGSHSGENQPESELAKLGGNILKVVLDFDKLLDDGDLPHQSVKELESRSGWYNPIVLEALRSLINEAVEEFISIEVEVNSLKPGMLLDRPVYSTKGILLLSEKQEVTLPLLLKLINFAQTGMISGKIQVSVPVSKFQVEDLHGNDGLTPPQTRMNSSDGNLTA